MLNSNHRHVARRPNFEACYVYRCTLFIIQYNYSWQCVEEGSHIRVPRPPALGKIQRQKCGEKMKTDLSFILWLHGPRISIPGRAARRGNWGRFN
jgi:hypothetical protein